MTLQQLNEHFELVVRFNGLFEMLQQLKASNGLKSQVLTGMPHGAGVNDPVSRLIIEISSMEEHINRLSDAINVSAVPVEDWIGKLDDYYAQTIFMLRFLHGMTWQQVTDLVGGGNTVQSIQMLCYRKLEDCQGHGKK